MPFPIWTSAARRIVRRWPQLESRALAGIDVACRLALLPFRRAARRGEAAEAADVVARTDAFNEAAERYFVEYGDPQFLLDKPFSDLSQTPKHLIDVGVMMQALRLRRGDVVLEVGAGTCWLSHMLNRCGCRTVALDVSPTALSLGRALFERDPRTDWSLDPRFLPYDGHRFPLEDGSCDRIVVNDAFHHVPNQREVLAEMRRVLRPDGVVAMSEPGAGHGTAAPSIAEAARTGVLENDLVLADVAALAEACGFAAARVVIASPYVTHEVAVRDLPSFLGGRGVARYWKAYSAALEQHHYLVLYRDPPRLATARPGCLSARLEILEPGSAQELSARLREPIELIVRATNLGDTHWLSLDTPGGGWTRLGAHLLDAAEPPVTLDFDWVRSDLPADVPPGENAVVRVVLPGLECGRYLVELDLVVEGAAWFADQGSPAARIRLHVV